MGVDSPLAGWGLPEAEDYALPLNVHSQAYELGRQVKTGPGLLYGFTAYSSNVAAQWIQLHDSIGAPASGAVPVTVFKVAAAAHIQPGYLPARPFLVGIWIGNSTTGPTYTAGAADTFFDVQYV